jgi:alpha-glucosidase
VKPWLPLGDVAARNVADQRRDPASVLSFCRRLLALRRAELAGRAAGYELVTAAEGLWAYRVGGLTVAANFSDAPVDAPDSVAGEVLLSTASGTPSATGVIGAWQGTIFRNATAP